MEESGGSCPNCKSNLQKKNLWSNFFFNMHLHKNGSTTFIFSTILNYFYHFQPFLLSKKCAYLKEVIRGDFDQCAATVNSREARLPDQCHTTAAATAQAYSRLQNQGKTVVLLVLPVQSSVANEQRSECRYQNRSW